MNSFDEFKKENKKWEHINHLDRTHEAVAPDYIDWLEKKINEYIEEQLSRLCEEVGCSRTDNLCPGNKQCEIIRSIIGD